MYVLVVDDRDIAVRVLYVDMVGVTNDGRSGVGVVVVSVDHLDVNNSS